MTYSINMKWHPKQHPLSFFVFCFYCCDGFSTAMTITSIQDATDTLVVAFKGFGLKESQVGIFIRNDCNLTVKRITRHPKARNSSETLLKRKELGRKMVANRRGLAEQLRFCVRVCV
ncbi:hypothetical protein CLU79DRAFT_777301 [Phycomyces nitens]|nr:hypothetical protein CLU79DRAFT_777301 [Phycomyces nitens]